MSKKDLENMSRIISEIYYPENDENILDEVVRVFNIYGDIWRTDDDTIEGNIDDFLRHDWHIDNESGKFIITQFTPTSEMDTSADDIIQDELRKFTLKEFMDLVKKHKVSY